MRKLPASLSQPVLQQILALGRKHWDSDNYEPNARRRFLRALQCKTGELGARLYRSSTEEKEFPNTCKSPACASCGHGAMIHWRRQRWCALPEGPYCAITFTMPDKLWSLFAANPQLCRRLPEIAARVVVSYGRVHKGVELGVMTIMQTFNGPLDFNPHVHLLVTARDLQLGCSKKRASFYFDGNAMARSWRRLVVGLLRAALLRNESGVACHEVQQVLDRAENQFWMPTHVRRFHGKQHFLEYAGRYVRRPPIASRRIVSVADGIVRFWYKDKRRKQRVELTCTVEEFIDRCPDTPPNRTSTVLDTLDYSLLVHGAESLRRCSQLWANAPGRNPFGSVGPLLLKNNSAGTLFLTAQVSS